MPTAPPLLTTRTSRVVRSASWEGRLSVSDGRLRFSPDDPEAPPLVRLDVEARAIVDARQNRSERLLVVELPGAHTIRFVGGSLDALHGSLRATILEPEGRPLDPAREISETHLASLRRGAIIHRGVVRLDAVGLEYSPQGLLDTLVGVRPFRIDWASIHRISPRPGPAGLIEIQHTGGLTRLEPAAPEGLFPSLLAGVHATQARTQRDPDALAAALSQADERGGTPVSRDPLHTVTLALHGTSDHGFEAGLLVIDEASLRWLPTRIENPEVTLPLLTLVRRSGRLRRLPTLRLAAGSDHHTFVPAIGTDAVQDLWRRVHAPSRVIPWKELGERTRERLVGGARFVRIQVGGGEPESVGNILECSEEARLVLGGSVLDGAQVGDRLHVEVGQDEGVYAFEADLGSRRFRPDGPLGPSQTTLVLRPPAPLRVYNQRQGYRAGVSLAATARIRVPSDRVDLASPIRLVVDDLSVGGCRAVSATPLPDDQSVDLWVDLGDNSIRVTAKVLRKQAAGPTGSTSHGLRFEQISAADEDRVNRFVLDLQRRALQTLASPPADESQEAGPGAGDPAPDGTPGPSPDCGPDAGPAPGQGPTDTG